MNRGLKGLEQKVFGNAFRSKVGRTKIPDEN
jgi:hypothetical protein